MSDKPPGLSGLTRPEIARRLHDLVDAWLDSPLMEDMGGVTMVLRVTYRSRTAEDDAITLVVGTEPADDED